MIATQTQSGGGAAWHLCAALTVRSAGTSGSVVGTLGLTHDNGAMALWGLDTQTATVNTTVSTTLDVTASIQDFSGAERVVCEQLIVVAQ